jgi:hypothetical protein
LAANFIGLALGIFLLVFAFVHNLYFSENWNGEDLIIGNIHFW